MTLHVIGTFKFTVTILKVYYGMSNRVCSLKIKEYGTTVTVKEFPFDN